MRVSTCVGTAHQWSFKCVVMLAKVISHSSFAGYTHANVTLLCQVVAELDCMGTLTALHTCLLASGLHTRRL